MLLTYHEINAAPSDYVYSATTAEFQEHLQLIRSFSHSTPPVAITFDDGHLSQFVHALPCLEQEGQKAAFFVTAGWTEKKSEYMNWTQLRELVRLGHDVQSHGWSHALLTHCTPHALRQELRQAKCLLEDRLGIPVQSISMPGGRWNAHVLSACLEEGYQRVYTSNPYLGVKQTGSLTLVGRAMVRNRMTPSALFALLQSEHQWWSRERIRFQLKHRLQKLLGDQIYHTLWSWAGNARQTGMVPSE